MIGGAEFLDDLLEEEAERVAGILEDRWENARRTGGHVHPTRPPRHPDGHAATS